MALVAIFQKKRDFVAYDIHNAKLSWAVNLADPSDPNSRADRLFHPTMTCFTSR